MTKIFMLLGMLAVGSGAQAATATFAASGNWTAPSGVTSVTVEAWGGGGGGGAATGNRAKGGGGAGGQYAKKVVAVTPGSTYAIVVGTGGAGGNAAAGGVGLDSTFAVTTVVAKGGAGGALASSNNGSTLGGVGAATGGVGDVVFAGGSGSDGVCTANPCVGGAGGGGAGSAGAGGDAVGDTAGIGTATGGGSGAAARTTGGNCGNAATVAGGGGCGGHATSGTNRTGGAGAAGQVVITYVLPPSVVSINTASTNPTAANASVSWSVLFDTPVTGVDTSDFLLVAAGGVSGASITSVTGVAGGASYTVTANTGTGTVGTLTLKLVDDDTIVNGSSMPLGGTGAANGNFTGQSYSLVVAVCTSGLLFCDDFERTVVAGGSNTATAVGTAPGYGAWTVGGLNGGAIATACAGIAGNAGCAGIDSDIPPFDTVGSPRANSTRAMYTRWSSVSVTSPVVNLAGKGGARLSFWLRRGSDCFSEWPSNNTTPCGGVPPAFTPGTGEEFQVQYKNNLGAWVVLAQYPMDDAPGEIIVPVVGLPSDALHAGFQLRFMQPGGSGSNATNGGAPNVRGYDYWHVDNVVLEEVPGPTFPPGPFCDTFEGDLSRWDMAGTGNVRIGSKWFENGIHGMDLRWNTVSATTKATDLSTNSGNNIISFWVKRGTGVVTTVPNTSGSEYPDTAAKGLKFEYFNNANAWVALTTFAGAGTDGQVFVPAATPVAIGTAASTSFTIPADAKHANFKLRITMLSGSGMFDQDYWHVDDVCVGAIIGMTDLALTMTSSGIFSMGEYVTYTMTAVNNGPNDDPGPIVITDELPVGLTYASASAGWTCSAGGPTGQTVTCTKAGGLTAGASATLTLTATVDAGASGTITNRATVGGQTNDTSHGNNLAEKIDTIFVPGYVFTDKPCVLDGTAVGTGAQCAAITWSPQTAGAPQTGIYISAVNASNVPTQLHATNSTTVNMQFGLACVNPIANAGVQATFSDAANTITLPLCETNVPPLSGVDTPGATAWSNTALGVTFPKATASSGPFSFNYNDVGAVELFMRNSALTTQMGRSGTFVVKPAGFVLSAISCTTADAANCGAGALAMSPAGSNPAAAGTAGASFIRAGHPFSMTVTALTASGKAKTDAAQLANPASPAVVINCSTLLGTPADCTPNYGHEVDLTTGLAAGESVRLLTPTNVVTGMVSPAPAVTCADAAASCDTTTTPGTNIPTFGAFSGAVATGNNFAWPEVGIIRVTPGVGDSNYLGAGDTTGTGSGNIGRFYPHHFNTVVVQVAGVPMGCPDASCPANYNGFVYSGQPFSLEVTAKNAADVTTANYNATTGFAKTTDLSTVAAPGSATTVSTGTLGVTSVSAFAAGMLTEAAEKYTFTTAPAALTNIYVRATDKEASSQRAVAATSVEGGVAVASGRIKVSNAYGTEALPLTLIGAAQYYGASGWVNSISDSVTSLTLPGSYSIGSGSSAVAMTPSSGKLASGKLNIKLAAPGAPGKATITPGVPSWLDLVSGSATFGVYKGNNGYIYRREN